MVWFKQLQIFQLKKSLQPNLEKINEKLKPLAFTGCLPSFSQGQGWISPLKLENAPLVHSLKDFLIFCLQTEEKILPAAVINQQVDEKIKRIELAENRKVRQNEKRQLKEELTQTLLPKAFSKISHVYAYIDTAKDWLIIDTASPKKAAQLINLLKRCLSHIDVGTYAIKKPRYLMTQWLKQDAPEEFNIEKSCVLQDASDNKRIIRCQQQDLHASSIQSFIKDGCEVQQLALNWQERLDFVLTDEFVLKSIKYGEEVIAAREDDFSETESQRFDVDFIIMAETLRLMLSDLLTHFVKDEAKGQGVGEKKTLVTV